MLPPELFLIIYQHSDIPSRIKLNTIFKWSYYLKNPYDNSHITQQLEYRIPPKTTTASRIVSIRGSSFVLPF